MASKPTFMSSGRVRDVRGRLGWTQEDLGEHLGYGRWTVSQWESGAQPVPAAVAVLLEIYDEHPDLIRMPRPVGSLY